MILALLMLAATPATTQQELVTAFAVTCLRDKEPLEHIDANAAASGFRPVPIVKSDGRNNETKAWERGGIRLFVLSGQTDPRWRLEPFCGVSGDIGKLGDRHRLLEAVANAASAPAMFGQGGGKHWTFHLPRMDDRGMVEVFVNQERRSHVQVNLLLQMPPKTGAEH